jgi:hypothetical protein
MVGRNEFVSLPLTLWEGIRSSPRSLRERAASQPLCIWPGEWQLS